MSLSELNIGKEGIIVHIDADPAMKDRLNGLGIIKSANIKTILSGFGIKLYEVKGSQFALRDEDAAKIFIR